MANYQTTVILAAPATGSVLLPNGSTVVTYNVDIGAQAAVAALMGNYATWNSDHTGLVIGGVAVPGGGSGSNKTVADVVTS
jgi:hypothetical protein